MSNSSISCHWKEPESESCKQLFPNGEELFKHIVEYHIGSKTKGNLSLKCLWAEKDECCKKEVDKRDHLVSHIKVHVPQYRPFVCQYCQKAFSRSHDLTKHCRTHKQVDYDWNVGYNNYNMTSHSNYNTQMLNESRKRKFAQYPLNPIDTSPQPLKKLYIPQYNRKPTRPLEYGNYLNVVTDPMQGGLVPTNKAHIPYIPIEKTYHPNTAVSIQQNQLLVSNPRHRDVMPSHISVSNNDSKNNNETVNIADLFFNYEETASLISLSSLDKDIQHDLHNREDYHEKKSFVDEKKIVGHMNHLERASRGSNDLDTLNLETLEYVDLEQSLITFRKEAGDLCPDSLENFSNDFSIFGLPTPTSLSPKHFSFTWKEEIN